MISVEHEDGVTVTAVFGKLELADYRRFEQEVIRQIAQQGRVKLLIDLRDMLGFTVDVALEDVRFAREHARDVGRIAILSERDAVAWTTLLAQLFVETELRVFDDEAQARAWLAGDQI
jgi:hypothetical protein